MKQDLIKDVVQGMLPYLNNAQSEKLQEVLSYALAKYEVTENQNRENNSEQNYIELFLAAKRIEGCSEKSLKYYKATIEMMSATVGKSVKHIETDDIRRYLTEYQEKKKSSKVTIDNIRRISSILQIVNITLDRAVDDAQAIFESLNSTGKELSESDLIRNYVLMGLEPSEQTYVYPFLLKIHHECTEELITSDELKEILKLCISYVLRRAICEIPTNSMNKTFATLKNYIKPDDYLNSVKAFFVMQDTYKEFPDNDKFEGVFVNRDIYNMRARNYILSRLENFSNKAPITIENYTIEHIMPQNKNLSLEWQTDLGPEWQEVQKKYLHTIGNLTLTAYNSEMSDRPFLDKMDMPGGFKESALRLNKYVVLQNEWNEKHIQERANELAKKAEAIWPYPTLTAEELAPYQAEEKTVQKYSLETYDVNAFTRMLFESLDKRIMNLSPAVKKEYKKLYVAYKLDTNFVDIVFQKQRLRISINMKFSEINDPNDICKDITGLGRWGNGDVELFMEHQDELDQIMEIVKQSYDTQAE